MTTKALLVGIGLIGLGIGLLWVYRNRPPKDFLDMTDEEILRMVNYG